MKTLLITSNATIEKLLVLSAQKRGDDVVIGSFEDLPDKEIKAIFIDKDEFDEEKFNNLKEKYNDDVKFVLILSRKDEKIEGFDDYLYKPFLPMEVINMLELLSGSELSYDNDSDTSDIDIESFDDLDDLNLEDDSFENLEKMQIEH